MRTLDNAGDGEGVVWYDVGCGVYDDPTQGKKGNANDRVLQIP